MNFFHIITGLEGGGAEAVLFRLVTYQQAQGDQCHVVSLTGRGIYADRLEHAGVVVHALGFSRGGVSIVGLIKLYKLLRQTKPEVVQTWMYHADFIGGIVSRLAGVRAIVWGIRGGNLDSKHNSRMTLLLVRMCACLSVWIPRKIVSCSLQSSLLHQAAGYCADKIEFIPNGYNLNQFQPNLAVRAVLRQSLGISNDEFVLGMVARFDVQKDHSNLIKALSLLHERRITFTCLLIGSGMDAENIILRNNLATAGISDQVRLIGPRGDISTVMNALDVHVLSSLGEAFPNVLAEAMACGTPCVTTDVGDAALIVDEHGWVVAPQSAAALADGLEQAHASWSAVRTVWQARQAACRAHIMANFELELMCKRYRAVWQQVMQADV